MRGDEQGGGCDERSILAQSAVSRHSSQRDGCSPARCITLSLLMCCICNDRRTRVASGMTSVSASVDRLHSSRLTCASLRRSNSFLAVLCIISAVPVMQFEARDRRAGGSPEHALLQIVL